MSDVKTWTVQIEAAFTVTFTSGPELDNYIDIFKNDGTLVVHGTSVGGSFVYDLDLGVYDVWCYKPGYVGVIKEDLVVDRDLTYDFGDLLPEPKTTAEFYACQGCGWWTGPFQVGMLQARIADFKVTNTGDQDGLVYVEIWEYPGEAGYENKIFDTNFHLVAGATGPATAVPVTVNIPSLAFFEQKYAGIPPPWNWDLCARVRGMSEEFEPCPATAMSIKVAPAGWKGQTLEGETTNQIVGLCIVAGLIGIPLILAFKK